MCTSRFNSSLYAKIRLPTSSLVFCLCFPLRWQPVIETTVRGLRGGLLQGLEALVKISPFHILLAVQIFVCAVYNVFVPAASMQKLPLAFQLFFATCAWQQGSKKRIKSKRTSLAFSMPNNQAPRCQSCRSYLCEFRSL